MYIALLDDTFINTFIYYTFTKISFSLKSRTF